LSETSAYRSYQRAREQVLAMQALPAQGSQSPSEYWSEELRGFEYMFDASPLIIATLRQHTYHLTGLRHYEYRTNRDRAADLVRQKLEALIETGGDTLLVPESPELGGFGFDIEGALYNVDTLKFFEVLLALDRSSVLADLRDGEDRKLVWEIGAGWGGFAAVYKTLFPNTTYVISDLPETMLFSATYLLTRLPDARFAFVPETDISTLAADALQYDFVFTPNTVLEDLTLPRLDLALNMVSFQEMSTPQVDDYMRRAHELGARYLYSLNRERSRYNPELRGVHRLMRDWFWPNEVEVLPVSYVTMAPRSDWTRLARREREDDYRHLIGWPKTEVA
jgi:putative sugar O-methyltransferase